jgi:hypothetical protein
MAMQSNGDSMVRQAGNRIHLCMEYLACNRVEVDSPRIFDLPGSVRRYYHLLASAVVEAVAFEARREGHPVTPAVCDVVTRPDGCVTIYVQPHIDWAPPTSVRSILESLPSVVTVPMIDLRRVTRECYDMGAGNSPDLVDLEGFLGCGRLGEADSLLSEGSAVIFFLVHRYLRVATMRDGLTVVDMRLYKHFLVVPSNEGTKCLRRWLAHYEFCMDLQHGRIPHIICECLHCNLPVLPLPCNKWQCELCGISFAAVTINEGFEDDCVSRIRSRHMSESHPYHSFSPS